MKVFWAGVFFCAHLTVVFGSDASSIAVLDFENHSIFDADSYTSLSSGLSQMMVSAIAPIPSLKIIERQRLKTILDEIKMSQAGFGTEDAAARIGQLAGARYLVFGGFMVAPGNKIRIDVRIVEVETGVTLLADEVTGKTKQILKLVDQLSLKLVKKLNLQLTKDEEKLLTSAEDVPMQAILHYSEGLRLEDQKEWKKAGASYLKATQVAPDFQLARGRLELMIQKVKNPDS